MSDELVRAKVARVVNSTDLALNRGTEAGVEVGMRFAILSDAGADIKDPETGEILDSVEIAKTVVKVINVTPRVSIARTFRKMESFGIGSILAGDRTRSETLNSDESTVQQELDPSKAKVKVGDDAIEYTGEFTGVVYDF